MTTGAEVPGAGDPSASHSFSRNTIREGTGSFSSGIAARSGSSALPVMPGIALLTLMIGAQFCSETERTNGDVGGDPQQEVTRGEFEWFLELFHRFTSVEVGAGRLKEQYESTKAVGLVLAGSMQGLRPMFVLLVRRDSAELYS